MTRRLLVLVMAILVLAAACGDDATTVAGAGSSDGSEDGESDNSSGSGSDDDTPDDAPDDDGPDNDAPDEDAPDEDAPDDDDFGEIIGDPDFDADNLPPEVADMVDDIDDIVSLGDCVAPTIGIGLTPPEGWICRVLDSPLPGFDGFTVFSESSDLEITVGTPSPIGACDLPGLCGNVTPATIPGFADAMVFDIGGIAGAMSGSHDDFAADLVVNHARPLNDDEIQFVADLMAGLMVI